MAWLFVDTHAQGVFRLGWLEQGAKPRVRTYKGRSHQYLARIVKLVEARGRAHVSGICVVAGPGAFSSVRTGVLQANLFARVWRVPLVGISVAEADALEGLSAKLATRQYVFVQTVTPVYESEPNITQPRKQFVA